MRQKRDGVRSPDGPAGTGAHERAASGRAETGAGASGGASAGELALRRVLREDGLPDARFDSMAYYVNRYLAPGDVSGRRMLEVGGADGTIALYLRLVRGARVDVLDEYRGHGGHAANEAKLRSRVERLGIEDVRVIRADVREVELAPAYAMIYSRNTFHHVLSRAHTGEAEAVDTLRRLRGGLVPGGELVIGDVSPILAWRLLPPLRRRLFPSVEYRSKSAYRRWRRAGRAAGLEFVGVDWYVPHRLRRLAPLLAHEPANAFLTGSYLLRLRKPVARTR